MSSVNTTQIDGDVSVGRNISAGGDATIQGGALVKGNLVVEGWLEAPNMKKEALGLFATEEKLKENYPEPRPGQYAYVGKTLPANLYVEENGEWKDTGTQGGSPELVDYNYAELETKLDKEISDRQAADTEHKNLIEGDPETIKDNTRNPFTYLGDFETWSEAKTELDKLHSEGEDKTKIGEYRLSLFGNNITVSNFVSCSSNRKYIQRIQGIIRWDPEDDIMDIAFEGKIKTYSRVYNEESGWTTWSESIPDINEANAVSSGLMSSEDKKKINSLPSTLTFLQLDEVVNGEGVYFTNATYEFNFRSSEYELKEDSVESKIQIPMAGSTAGIMSVEDKKKLDLLKPLTYVDHGTSDTSISINAFEYHRWGIIPSLVINIPNEPVTNGIINVYMFEFVSGSVATKIAFPLHIKTSPYTIETNKVYRVTVINNLATIKSFG